MTFEQLDFFIAAVESDTFFEAAEKVNTTQSTLSKQIRKLETELGFSLFDRSMRSATLTPGGKAFYKEALNLSAQYHQTLDNMRSFQSHTPTELRIGALPLLAQYALAEPLLRFTKEHPELSISLSEAEEPELIARLKNRTFDFIIARETMIDPAYYKFMPIAKDRLSVMLPVSHPLAEKNILSLSEIASEPLILMHSYTSIYQLCTMLFKNAGLTPHVARTARMESIISAVRFGEGISLFPEKNFLTFEHAGLVAIPLSDAPELLVGIACRKNGIKKDDTGIKYADIFRSFFI